MNTIDIPMQLKQVAEQLKHGTKICIVLGKID